MTLGGSPEDIRAQYDQLVEILLPQLPPPSDAVESKDGEVEGIKYRLYTPKEASKKGPLPVAIWTHGGGWMTGDINSDDLLCRVVAEAVPSIIINVDYRLSPEFKVPTQLQDTLTVYKWVSSSIILSLADSPLSNTAILNAPKTGSPERGVLRRRPEQILQHRRLRGRCPGTSSGEPHRQRPK